MLFGDCLYLPQRNFVGATRHNASTMKQTVYGDLALHDVSSRYQQ